MTGLQNMTYINSIVYLDLIESSSKNCLINESLTKLVTLDKSVDYTGSTVSLDASSGMISVNTSTAEYLSLFIHLKTSCSQPLYLPLYINIVSKPVRNFNAPPFFEMPNDMQINFMLNETRAKYEFRFNLSE